MRRVLTLIWVELEAACSNKSGKGKSDKGGTEDVYLWKFQVGIPLRCAKCLCRLCLLKACRAAENDKESTDRIIEVFVVSTAVLRRAVFSGYHTVRVAAIC
jgi:hypothetical protein